MNGKNKPDLMDGILFYEGLSSKNKYPDAIWDYPELSIELLKAFSDIWCLPEGAFPRKREQKKYADWCSQLDKLGRLFSSDARMRLAMQRAYDNYKESGKNIIIHQPRAIEPLVISAIAELRREERKRLKELESKQKTLESPETIKRTTRNLKNIFESEDD